MGNTWHKEFEVLQEYKNIQRYVKNISQNMKLLLEQNIFAWKTFLILSVSFCDR